MYIKVGGVVSWYEEPFNAGEEEEGLNSKFGCEGGWHCEHGCVVEVLRSEEREANKLRRTSSGRGVLLWKVKHRGWFPPNLSFPAISVMARPAVTWRSFFARLHTSYDTTDGQQQHQSHIITPSITQAQVTSPARHSHP